VEAIDYLFGTHPSLRGDDVSFILEQAGKIRSGKAQQT
jgi:hypothetical protein